MGEVIIQRIISIIGLLAASIILPGMTTYGTSPHTDQSTAHGAGTKIKSHRHCRNRGLSASSQSDAPGTCAGNGTASRP
ncbi:MAG: hypothetical protein AAFO61_00930 [Pseudomonadota bacterium]